MTALIRSDEVIESSVCSLMSWMCRCPKDCGRNGAISESWILQYQRYDQSGSRDICGCVYQWVIVCLDGIYWDCCWSCHGWLMSTCFVLQVVCDLWVMINVHGSRVIVDKNWTKERLGAGLPVGS